MSFTVEQDDGGWRVTNSAPRGPLTQLSVPSEGGSAPAGAPLVVWVLAAVSILALTALAELLLRALRTPAQRVP
jgi:hypothetical protein